MIWLALALLLVLPLAAAAWRIDDWQRDLSTNQASTSPDADDPLLQPLEYPGSMEDLSELVQQAATDLPRWQFEEKRTEGEDTVLHLTHQTALFGFTDDIHVTLQPQEAVVHLTAHSQSRIGKGDLGQNPRNLKQLLGEVRRRMELATE